MALHRFSHYPFQKLAFAPLADLNVFRGVYIDYGTAVWYGGDIDIAPETLYFDTENLQHYIDSLTDACPEE